jgi:hypothetical protein
MSITFPVKQILKFKVPGVIALGLILGQFLMTGDQSSTKPNCTLKVERPHNSTSLYENRKIKTIKLNIVSECDSPQRFTTLRADIQTIKNDNQITAHDFGFITAKSSKKISSKAFFLDLFLECKSSESALYLGQAAGNVHFDNGVTVPVSGNSIKFLPVDCNLGAK